jgi:hypothetical protein
VSPRGLGEVGNAVLALALVCLAIIGVAATLEAVKAIVEVIV